MTSQSTNTNFDNFVFLRGVPDVEGHQGHPRGILLVRVDPERQLVHLSASVMSHTEPNAFNKNEGVALAAARPPGSTARTAIFLRCEDPDEAVRNAHRVDTLRHAQCMAVEAILATNPTEETLELLVVPEPQAVLTAIIYALQGRGGINVADATKKAAEAKRTEVAEIAPKTRIDQVVSLCRNFHNELDSLFQSMKDEEMPAAALAVQEFVVSAMKSPLGSV